MMDHLIKESQQSLKNYPQKCIISYRKHRYHNFNAIAKKANVLNYIANVSLMDRSVPKVVIVRTAKIESTTPKKDKKLLKKP